MLKTKIFDILLYGEIVVEQVAVLLHGEIVVGEVAVGEISNWGNCCWGNWLLGKLVLGKMSRGSYDWGSNLTPISDYFPYIFFIIYEVKKKVFRGHKKNIKTSIFYV